ncbi:MAG: ABC transporter substrate-binding protein [Chloroflexi bacterium]|nr:ABC transporter substrate-binding protein [Chloroflexota bacterium]
MQGSIRVVWKTLAAAALLFAACGPAAQEATPTPTRPAAPTAAPTSAPRATAAPTAAPAGTAAPTATPAPKPTAAPSVTVKTGGTLRAYNRAHPSPWDPIKQITGSRHLRNVEKSVFSAITMQGVEGDEPCAYKYRNDLGEKWAWLDDATFEIKVRQGVRFHDKPPVNGRELTAEDVVWSWKRIFANNPRFEPEAKAMRDIVAVDKYTVRFLTTQPVPSLIDRLGQNTTNNILAKESGDFSRDKEWGDWDFPEKSYIGTGPFMWVQDVPAVKIVLAKHPHYWKKGQPYLDGLEFVTIADVATRFAAVVGGKLDLWFAEAGAPQALAAQKANPNLVVQKCPLLSSPLTVYMRTDEPPFNDVRVRRAVLMAIDQKGLIQSAYMGEALPSSKVFHAALSDWYLKIEDYPPEIRKYLEHNPTEAKKLLAEAGYPQGFETVFNYYTGYGSPFNEATEALAAMLENVGIRVKLRAMERGAYNTMKSKGDYHGITPTKTTVEDPRYFLGTFHSDFPVAQNTGWVKDPQLDPLLEELSVTTDEAKAKDLARRVQLRMADQAWAIAAPSHFDYSIAQPYVKGFKKGGDDGVTRNWSDQVWLDK